MELNGGLLLMFDYRWVRIPKQMASIGGGLPLNFHGLSLTTCGFALSDGFRLSCNGLGIARLVRGTSMISPKIK